MINLVSNNAFDLYKMAFLEVYKLPDLKNDLRNYKDASAILTINDYQPEPGIYLDKNGFKSSFNYDEYILGGNDWMKVEIKHYDKEYLDSGKIESLVKLFKYDPYTRRGVISLWDNPKLDLRKPFPCTVYAWFRRIGNKLNMNYHMRANDAYKILLMDIHIATCLHVYVAKRLNLGLGEYNHFVDTLHFYKEHKKEIDKLYNRLHKAG